jgi:hypothetical protein
MDQGLLTTARAAEVAGVSKPTWVKIAESNSLQPVTREGSRTRWWRSADVQRLLGASAEKENA